jgi:GGDEF domain-containing protein
MYPDNGEDAETLLKNADNALYYVKEHGRDNYHYI